MSGDVRLQGDIAQRPLWSSLPKKIGPMARACSVCDVSPAEPRGGYFPGGTLCERPSFSARKSRTSLFTNSGGPAGSRVHAARVSCPWLRIGDEKPRHACHTSFVPSSKLLCLAPGASGNQTRLPNTLAAGPHRENCKTRSRQLQPKASTSSIELQKHAKHTLLI